MAWFRNFRRKGSSRRARTVPMSNPDFHTAGRGRQSQQPPRSQTEPLESTTPDPGPSRGGKRDSSSKLQRRQRTYSFSPGRRDSLRVAKTRKESIPPLPSGPLPAVADEFHGRRGGTSASNNDLASRVPTLHHGSSSNKRRGQDLARRKSSKRRKEDHVREAEIKAMSQFEPIRPATDSWTAGRPMKKDSKRYKTGLNRSWERPISDISLPTPESIHSAMSSDSEHVSWKVSALDSLAPRPTLRYASHPVYGQTGPAPFRSSSTRRKVSDKGVIHEEVLKAHKRVDDLADDLGSSDIRELMERDRRRREQKKQKDQERIERRLARRSEKQRAEEAEAVKRGTPPPPNLERGVLGRELPESSGQTSAVITSSRHRKSADSSRRASKESIQVEKLDAVRHSPSPSDRFYRTDSIPKEEPEPTPEVESEGLPEAAVAPSSRSSSPRILSFLRPKKSRSKSPRQSSQEHVNVDTPSPAPPKPEYAESGGRTSDSGSSRPWKSFFRWGRNRRSSGPSSFSNTSRDSMLASQPPPPSNYNPPRHVSSGVPKRTMSRFREDLPELPMSPPDSRIASPEVEPLPAEPLPVIRDDVPMRYDSPGFGEPAHETMRETPSSGHRDEVQPSPAPQSMSLASIDSEGSWLSGRISRQRASSGMRNSLSQYPPQEITGESEGRNSAQTEDENLADDEYLNSVVPSHLHRKSTGEARPSSDEEREEGQEGIPIWGAVGQTPRVMHHRETMRSREGLLSSFDDEKEFEKDSEGEGQSPVEPQRATSVNLGKGHIRNFSAGSAKLLEISPRPSGEHRRSPLERATQ
ncbi:hypothetical protein F4778DRAFT_627156 [Xylariomycetidae sp. FL2044]|nr:hypothetical protein F4778DRAFT_627156 [Xylariomycetidae sp. FL2044]